MKREEARQKQKEFRRKFKASQQTEGKKIFRVVLLMTVALLVILFLVFRSNLTG
ncbi:MAG: hypothetical protein AAF502_19665 [Bacteroidota bacterium]